jgi:adenylylsulfate kinase
LYKKAIAGEIKEFTGISDPYESPKNPHCILDSGAMRIDESINILMNSLESFWEK